MLPLCFCCCIFTFRVDELLFALLIASRMAQPALFYSSLSLARRWRVKLLLSCRCAIAAVASAAAYLFFVFALTKSP
jgi:hypothetical protein